jgi:DNA-binding NtrC family response regulator
VDAAPTSTTPQKPVLLLIEDEISVRRTIVVSLTRAGYEVLEAATATEARTQWEANADRLVAVVSDNMLGAGPTGLSLLRQFIEARTTLPTILISGVLTTEVIRSIETSSTIRCLQKPFDFRALIELIARRRRELGPS